MEQTKIISARRAYEFHPDDVRLSMLSLAAVRQAIQQSFSFEVAQIATPMQTFGPILNTIPPGLVFDFGNTQTPEGDPTPLRFLHIEPSRLVIDVAGPSSAIDFTFEHLWNVLSEVESPDGSPLIGEPHRIRDYSEISTKLKLDPEELFGNRWLTLAQKAFGGEDKKVIPLGVRFQAIEPGNVVKPAEIGHINFARGNLIEIRTETNPENGVYLSGAEVPTDQHLAWLESLERELSKA